MIEIDFEKVTKKPSHLVKAEKFIGSVISEIAPMYPEIRIVADNTTESNLNDFAEIIEQARKDKDKKAIDSAYSDDYKKDRESAFATRVHITLIGNNLNVFNRAVATIVSLAMELRASNSTDLGVQTYGPKKIMEKVYGSGSYRDELSALQRKLEFLFGEIPKRYNNPPKHSKPKHK